MYEEKETLAAKLTTSWLLLPEVHVSAAETSFTPICLRNF